MTKFNVGDKIEVTEADDYSFLGDVGVVKMIDSEGDLYVIFPRHDHNRICVSPKKVKLVERKAPEPSPKAQRIAYFATLLAAGDNYGLVPSDYVEGALAIYDEAIKQVDNA